MFNISDLAKLTEGDPTKLPHLIVWEHWKGHPLVDSIGRLHIDKKWMPELYKHFDIKFLANFGPHKAKRYSMHATPEMLLNMENAHKAIGILPDETGDSAKRNLRPKKIRPRGLLIPASKIN